YNVTVKAQSTGGCFTNCWNLEQCIAENGNKGFYWCNHLSNCIAYNCFTGFNDCRYIENCKAQFYDTSCKSLVNGFYYCYAINTCYASVKTGDKAIGFSSCRMVSTSHASVSTKSTTAIKFGFSGSSDLQGCNGSFGYCEYMVNCAGVNTECVSVVNHKDSAWSM
ncbi:MAG: hypothetical protein IKZ04_04410, partial [Spirochaetaceae bacterium]|nr:hypothetical protein [Spirochaetaceae bacterium]